MIMITGIIFLIYALNTFRNGASVLDEYPSRTDPCVEPQTDTCYFCDTHGQKIQEDDEEYMALKNHD